MYDVINAWDTFIWTVEWKSFSVNDPHSCEFNLSSGERKTLINGSIPGAHFSKVLHLFEHISGDIMLFASSKRRGL